MPLNSSPKLQLAMSEGFHTSPTLYLLMAQYNGKTVVPLDQICRDFFGHLTIERLLRKALRGDIALPIVRIEASQKAPSLAPEMKETVARIEKEEATN